MGNIVKIDKDRLSQMLVEYNNGENVFDSSTSYIIDLKNCNGLTSDYLEQLEKLGIDFKFKINGDLYRYGEEEYNYDVHEMKKIVGFIECIGEVLPQDNELQGVVSFFQQKYPDAGVSEEFVRFVSTYRILCEYFHYDDNQLSIDADTFVDRSLYGTIIEGIGVCTGFNLTLSNVLNYYGTECKRVNGLGYDGENWDKHGWNAVRVNDKWYFADLTFDINDPQMLSNCLRVEDDFNKSHDLDMTSLDALQGLDFAEKDFDSMQLATMNMVFYKMFDLQTSVDTLKEYKKPRQNTISDSPADLARALFGDDFMSMFEGKKSNEAVEAVAGESNKGM